MAGGALQDSVKAGVKAEIDIRDNLISLNADDQYKSLRPYWDNISIRQPFALPFFSEVSKVNFSKPAGFYESSIQLELSTNRPNNSHSLHAGWIRTNIKITGLF